MENQDKFNEIAYQKAEKRVKEVKNYYFVVIIYVLVSIFLLYDNNYEHFFRFKQNLTQYLLLFQGIVLIGYGIYLFVPFFQNWEKRQIRKYMQKFEKNAKK